MDKLTVVVDGVVQPASAGSAREELMRIIMQQHSMAAPVPADDAAGTKADAYTAGDEVELFYRASAYPPGYSAAFEDEFEFGGRIGVSTGWQRATVVEDWDAEDCTVSEYEQDTWVLLRLSHNRWVDRSGASMDTSVDQNRWIRAHPAYVRNLPAGSGEGGGSATQGNAAGEDQAYPPSKLSFLVVRWGGEAAVALSDGGQCWGPSGCTISGKP
jgi:hypothetical protein